MVPNISAHALALSDSTGRAVFHQSSGQPPNSEWAFAEGWDLSGSLCEPRRHLEVHPWVTFDTQSTVETITLDDWATLHGLTTIDFIWMDVQGAEHRVFRGGSEVLRRTRYLYTEYSDVELYDGQLGLVELLQEFLPGWRVLARFPNDVLLQNYTLARHPSAHHGP